MQDFTRYLRDIAAGFPSKQDLARAIGISAPRLSHALAGTGGYTLNVENCLRLAKVANRSPVEVLRAAGKADIAELLEYLFPKAGKPVMTGAEHRLLERIRALDAGERALVEQVLDNAERHRRKASPTPTRAGAQEKRPA